MNVTPDIRERAVAAECCTAPDVGSKVLDMPPHHLAWALTHMPMTAEERAELFKHPAIARFAKRRGIPRE